jgi:hypothetical protein
MAYVMTPEHAKRPAEPSVYYFGGILQGYKENGMPTQPLYDALRNTHSEVSELGRQERQDFRQMEFGWRPNKAHDHKNGDQSKPKHKGR